MNNLNNLSSLYGNSFQARGYYGVLIDKTNSSPDLERVASPAFMILHASLPVQATMRGCLLADNGSINYYLKPEDWTKKADGSASDLTGAHGMVVVSVGPYYRRRRVVSADVDELGISLYPLAGFSYVPRFYVGAYEAALQRSTNKLASVVNATADFRGGNNNAALDAGNNTLLGKPATLISGTNFRTYARNRAAGGYNWNKTPLWYSMLIYELFMIDYSTRNSQKAVNAGLTAEGYKQGGLGAGVTTLVSAAWNTFNAYYPAVPCGASNSLGNGSGEVGYIIPGLASVKVPRYRGIENIFGHLWEFEEGNILHGAAGGVSKYYSCDNPQNFADATLVNYDYAGDMPLYEGYIKSMKYDTKGRMFPGAIGGASNTYYCDYFYTPGLVNGWRAVLRGGDANAGALAGFSGVYTIFTASYSTADIGARLCYIP